MSNASLDRKIYSLFKKGVYNGNLEVLGVLTATSTALILATNSVFVGVAGIATALAIPASRVLGRLSSGAVAAIQITNAEIDAAAAIALTKMNWLPGIVMGAVTGVGLSMAPIAAAAGLKIHTHAATGAVYDYANEFKGESVKTSGFYDGLALDYKLDGSGTSILRAIRATIQLNSGKSMTGTDYATQSMLAAGVFSASVSGTINGAGVTVAGVLGQISSNDLGTLTTCKYMAAVWADWASHVELGTGISAIILATVGEGVGAAIVDYGIYMATSTHCTTGIALSGTYTDGIDLSGATLTEGSDNALFGIGSYSTAKVVALTTTGFYTPFQINLLSSTNPSGGETIMAGAYIKVATGTIDQAAMNSVALNLRNTIGKSQVSAYGLQSHMTFVTVAEIDGAGTAAAVSGKITLGHANTSGVIAVGYFTLDGGYGPAVAHGVWIDIVGSGTIATNGLVIAGTGAMNKGINLSGANMVEGTDNALFCIGSYSSAKSVTLLTDAFFVPFHINLLSAANPISETIMSGTYIKTATTGNQANMNLVGEVLRVTVGGNVAQAYGVQCHLTVAGACVAGTNANVCAGSFKTVVNAAMTATVNVLLLTYEGSGAVSGERNMITIDPTTAVKNGIMVYSTANLTNLFEFAANAGCAAGASKATQSAASAGSIKIVIGGTDYYIPYFA